jgi:transposase
MKLEAKIQDHLTEYRDAVALWTTIPGIAEVVAANLIAEIGVKIAQFPSAQHLARWAGSCPGNSESAASTCQAAWPASHAKDPD